MRVAGIVLAAGQGRRMGQPKALVLGAGGSWLQRATDAVRDGGCAPVLVVLGAAADEAAALTDARVVIADDWQDGLGASLRAGLQACPAEADAALVTLVDLPDVDQSVVSRVLAAITGPAVDALVRSTFDGSPGHPVVVGRNHWPAALGHATGDQGARRLFAAEPHTLVECGDLATGRDVDTPEALEEFGRA